MRTMRELLAAASAKKSDPDPNLEEFSQVIKPFRPKTWDDVLKADRQAQQESTNENSFSDYLGTGVKNALDTFIMQAGLQAQGLGLQIGDLANTDYYKNNPNAPVAKVAKGLGGTLDKIGESALDMYNEDASHHTSEEWANTALGDILSDPELRGRYFSDPQGFAAELGSGFGSAGEFAALTAILSKLGLGKFADKVSGKALSGASSLLSKANLPELATMAGSDLAKSLFGTTLQFGSTMGPAGALTNAATTIDPQRQQGKSDEEIAAANRSMVAEELPADMLFAILTGQAVTGNIGKAIAPKNSTAWQKALANAAGVPIEGAGGYYSNVEQMILADKYSGNPYGTLGNPTPNESAAGRMGVIAGLPFSAYGGVRGYLNAKAKENAQAQNEKVSKAFSDLYQNFRQDFSDNAEAQARQSLNLTEKQAEIWDAAQYASAEARRRYNYDVPPELIYKQWAHEAGINFDSPNARYNNNFGGLTQVEPNGEENKQPDGDNYYRHFNNVKEYADAYVQDFLKYYPEINGVKNEREFASVLKKYGYFGDTLEAYASDMEKIAAPSGRKNIFNVDNYDMPTQGDNITEQVSQLKDGWQTIIPQIGGVLKERFGLNAEISSAARTAEHNAEVGGVPTSHHIIRENGGDALDIVFNRHITQEEQDAIADYFKGTGLFSEVLYHDVGSGAHLHLGGLKTENLSQNNDSLADRADTNFKQNYKPYQETFADRLKPPQEVQNQSPTTLTDNSQITNPLEPAQVTEQADTPKDFFNGTFNTNDNAQIISTADKFLEQLREEGDPQKASLLFQLQRARNNGDVAAIENLLKQNNVAISPPTQEVIETNPPPPKQLSGLEKLIKVASAPVAGGKDNTNKRARQGKALLRLAQQNNIEVPSVDTKALEVGSTVKVQEWRDKFLQAGLFNEPQESAEVKKARRDWGIFKTVSQERGQKIQEARKIADNLFNLSEADENNAAGVAAPVYDSEVMEQLDRKESKQAAQRQWQANENERIQKQEEYRRWQAKQAKELKELQARQAEAKRLVEVRRQLDEQNNVDEQRAVQIADTRAAQAEEQVQQAEEQNRQKLKAQSQQAGEYALQGLAQTQSENLQAQRQAPQPNEQLGIQPPKTENTNTKTNNKLYTALRAKLKVDTHPYVGKYLDKLWVTASSKNKSEERTNAIAELKKYREMAVTDEMLDNAEQRWAKEEKAKEENERQVQAHLGRGRAIFGEETNPVTIDNAFRGKVYGMVDFKKYPEIKTRVDEWIRLHKRDDVEETKQEYADLINSLKGGIDKYGLPYEAAKVLQDKFQIESGVYDKKSQNYHSKELMTIDEKLNDILGNEKLTGEEQYQQVRKALSNTEPPPKVEESPAQSEKKEVRGNLTQARSATRKKYQVQYKVVDVKDLITSHKSAGLGVVPNENFPQELQPRDRESVGMQHQPQTIGEHLDPEELLDSPYINLGAPVVRNDGVVLNGNGRAMGIRYAYDNVKENGETYKQSLIHNAERFGLNGEEISKMENPVLVREVPLDLSGEEISDVIGDTTGGARMNAVETASTDTGKITASAFGAMPEDGIVDSETMNGRNFLANILGKVLKPNENNAYSDKQGAINSDGVERAKRTLYAIAYDDETLLRKMSESLNDDLPKISNALKTAAPLIAKVKKFGEENLLHQYDLSAIPQAVNAFRETVKNKQTVEQYLNQETFEGMGLSPESREILLDIGKNKKSAQTMADFFMGIAKGIEEQGEPRGEDIFGNKLEPRPLIDVIREAQEKAEELAEERNNKRKRKAEISLFSRTANSDVTIKNFVADQDLTPQQKLLKNIGEKLGTKIVFFDNPEGNFHGAHSNGITYLNVNSKMPLGKVFWHESMHWLKANNPKLYQQLVEAAGITDAQREAYLKKTKRNDLEDNAAIDEEIIADAFEDIAKRTGLLQNIAGKNRGLVQRVVQWLKDTMNKFIDTFRNPQGKLTTAQSQALADEFGRIANKLVDSNGEKIFRYNNRTKNIELADGRSLESVRSDNTPKYSFAGKKAKTANLETLKQAKKMEERGADRDKIYEITGWFKGKDDKWRFEIPDNREQMNIKRLVERGNFGKPTPLEEIYDNPELFEAYPQLRKITIKAVDPSDTGLEGDLVRGSDAVTYGKSIFFNMDRIFDEMDECQKTLVHEIQHMIQDYEKFSSGGNYEQVKAELRRNADMIMRAVDKIPEGKKYFDSIFAVKKAIKRGNEQAETKARKEMTQARQNLSPKDKKNIETLARRYDEIKTTKLNSNKAKVEAYYRLGGEQESRHVEERLDNREGTPVAHDDDALIVFGGKTYPLNKKIAYKNSDGELVEGSIPRSAATTNGTTDKVGTNVSTGSDNKGGVSPNANVETNSPSRNIPQDNQGSKPKYSIGANNSDESTLQRIRNKAAAWFSGRKSLSERRNKRIVQRIEGLTNYKVAFNGVDETIVDDFHKVIRAPHAYQWEKFLPAVSEKIAHVLKLPAQKEMANYITDWILTGALNNTSAEAAKFQKAMRDDPPTAEALIALRNEFKEITEMTPEERYGEKIVHPQKTLTAKIREKFTKEEWIDDLAPLQKMIDQITEDQPELGAELKKGINPLEMARLYRGKGGMISDLMIHGTAKNLDKIKAALQEQYPNVNFKWFKPLDMIIEEAGGQKNLRALEIFAVAKLDKEIFEWNRAHPDDKVTPTNPNEAEADAVIKNGEAQFGQAQRDLVSFSRTLLDFQHDAGLITDKQYFSTINSWQNYIPMARVFDENENFGFMSSLKGEKTGSERDTYTPIGRLIINANEYIRQAERNKIKQELAGLARMGAFAKYIEERDTSKVDAKNHIVFYENGKRKYLQTAPEVVRAVEALGGRTESVMIVKLLHAATKAVTASYTTLNLDFAAGNPFRDLADSYLHNKHIGKNPLPFIMDGFVQIFKGLTGKRANDADFIEWVANGGSQASLVSPDIDYVQRDIDSLGTTFKERFRKNPFSTVLEGLQRVAEHGEQAVRLANYRVARDALAKQRADGKATVEDKRKAALISREASIDFAKAGRSTRVANRVFAFTNATVQSWNLDYQRYVEPLFSEEGRKKVWSNYFKLGMMYMVPAILQAILCYGKDWWKEKKDWEKETYWFFGDKIKIPKGLDVAGRLTAAFTDAALSSWFLNEPVEAKRFATTVKDAMPSLTTTIFTPLIETALNRSWFRQAPIVPASEQHLPAHLQYGEETSPVAKLFGEQTGVSPRKIDYMINGYLGFFGKLVSGKYSLDRFDELPLVHRFKNVPYKNSKSVQRFYEVYDEQDKLYNGYKLELKRDPKTKPPKELDMALYRRLKRAMESMQRISKLRKLIEADKKLSTDKREEKLLALEKQRMALCQQVLSGAR